MSWSVRRRLVRRCDVGGGRGRALTAIAGSVALLASVVLVATVATATVASADVGPGDPANGGVGANGGFPGPAPSVTPPTGHVHINVTAGGDRAANAGSIDGLAGARFAAFQANSAGTAGTTEQAWCTTDDSGQCYVDVPTTTGGAQYLVKQTGSPAGFDIVSTLRSSTGSGATGSTAWNYQFLTGAVGTPTRITVPRPQSTNTTATTTAGSWINRRDNPTVSTSCSLNVGLLVDLSHSVSTTANADANIHASLKTFRDTLTGTDAKIAVHTFGTASPATTGAGNAGFNLTTPSAITDAQIDGITSNIPTFQYTNWDAGLWSFAAAASQYNVVFVLTDGYPTRYGAVGTPQGNGANTRFIELENAVASANYLKAQDVHTVAVGIGSGAAGAATNLQAISGDNPTTDYFQIGAGYTALEAYLKGIANSACNGTVSVQKNIVSQDGSSTSPAGSGWAFNAAATSPIVKVDGGPDAYAVSADGTTSDNGALTYRVDFSAGGDKTLTIVETQKDGFLLKPYPDGKFAQCGTGTTPTDDPLPVTNVGVADAATGETVGFKVSAQLLAIVKCQIQNQQQDQTAALQVVKHWEVYSDDGAGNRTLIEKNDGPSPTALPSTNATLNLASDDEAANLPTNPQFGSTIDNLRLNSTVTFGETITNLRPLCTNVATSDPVNGKIQLTVPSSSPDSPNTASITNVVTCRTQLSLVKNVANGTADPDNWLLTAHPAGSDAGGVWTPTPGAVIGPEGVSGSTGATGSVTPAQIYPLGEAANPAVSGSDAQVEKYVQDFNPTQQAQWGPRHTGGSTGSWTCVAAESIDDGTPAFGTNQVDGRNGGVTVPLGQWYQCTANNRLKPTLQLVKKVSVNGVVSTIPVGGGSWTLRAGDWVPPTTTPSITPFPGTQPDVSGLGGYPATPVQPGTYSLSESPGSVDGYTNGTTWSCLINNETVEVTTTVALVPGDVAACTIVNTLTPPQLQLTKTPVSVVAAADGKSWDITYTMTVRNPSTAGAALDYSLSDTPQFDASVKVNSASATFGGASVGTFAGGVLSGLATNKSLAAGATDTYTVVVNATGPADPSDDIANCAESGKGHGFYNLGTATSGGDTTTAHACLPIPHWTLVKNAGPATGTPVDTVGSGDADHTITYTLTAANPSTQAAVDGAVAVDALPANVMLVKPLPAGLTVAANGRTLTWAIPHMAAGASVSVSYKVTVDDAAAGTTITNVVQPTTPGGSCRTTADCTTHHPVKELIATVAHSCVNDAAYLSYTVTTKNVANANSLPVTVTWRTADGTVARVDTIPAGQSTGSLLWPGMVINTDGVGIGFPGWRPLVPSDFPLAPDAQVYGTVILDPSLPSFAYRQPMTVTFKMNPQDVVETVYPDISPAGCAVPRKPELTIAKTASVSTVSPGTAFSYGISVANTSALGVAYPVTLSDPIPATIAVHTITTSTTASPRWENCAVTGADGAGFGGMLNCTLSGALGVSATAPLVTLAVTVSNSAPAGNIVNTATTCWLNPSDATQPQQCASSSVTVTVTSMPLPPPPLPNTGVPATQLAITGLLLLLGGGLMLTLGMGRRRRPMQI